MRKSPSSCSRSLLIFACLFFASSLVRSVRSAQPNIVFILADDLGYADVSYNVKNPDIHTPNIDALASSSAHSASASASSDAASVRLSHYYVHCVCTPSRAALMTGRYAHNTGLNGPLLGMSPLGLDSNFTTLPQQLKKLGYMNHMVGKWHLGHAKWSYTPTRKGFDSFVGSFHAAGGYFSKFYSGGYDLQNHTASQSNEEIVPILDTTHYTEMVAREADRVLHNHVRESSGDKDKPIFLYLAFTAPHSPLQPLPRHAAKCQHIQQAARRDYCGLVVGVDEAVGNVTRTLRQLGLFDNSIIVFSSDNGGQPWVGGHNAPLRGAKHTLFEGGTRAIGFVSFGKDTGLKPVSANYDGLMHIADWYPTLLSLSARASSPPTSPPSSPTATDGKDMSSALLGNTQSPRTEAALYFDDATNMNSYRDSRYKLIVGYTSDGWWTPVPVGNAPIGRPDSWIDWAVEGFFWLVDSIVVNRDYTHMFFELVRHKRQHLIDDLEGTPRGPRLFDLQNDPYEKVDLASQEPERVQAMLARMQELKATSYSKFRGNWQDIDPKSKPRLGANPALPSVKFHVPWLADDVDVNTVELVNAIDRAAFQAKIGLPVIFLTVLALPVLLVYLLARNCRSKVKSTKKTD